jgi:hypothetical protein
MARVIKWKSIQMGTAQMHPKNPMKTKATKPVYLYVDGIATRKKTHTATGGANAPVNQTLVA